jgi:hypothetical protein
MESGSARPASGLANSTASVVSQKGDDMIALISALLMAGSTPVTNEAAPDLVALRVRAYADKQVDKATIRPALEVADDLLASAGLVVAWRVCNTAQSCPAEDTPVPEIVVILSSRDWPNGRENCGVAAHGARDVAGTVMVSVPCVAGVAFRLTRRPGTGTHPLLAMPRHDDLIGAIVAHEIGHLLGIRHASAGVMRARRHDCAQKREAALQRGRSGQDADRSLVGRRESRPLVGRGIPSRSAAAMRMLEDEKRAAPLRLSAIEKGQLVAFLRTLSGDVREGLRSRRSPSQRPAH